MSDQSYGHKASSVTFEQVTKRYNKTVTAVDNISFTIEAGQLVTLLGPSGCGKTTTLRLIAGLEMCTTGDILIGDETVTQLPATERDVSMVFQSYALFPHMTVIENVAYGLKFSGYKSREARERASEGLDLVGLSKYAQRLPSELSGGQQQRVAVARALVLEPQVLLFDEPLSNLDAKLRRQVREEIRDIQTSLGLTVVYVTHDQEEALAVSDNIMVMNNAVVAQHGSPRELYDAPSSEFVADFIGEANIFQCEVDQVESGVAHLHVGDMPLSLPARGVRKGQAQLAVRPGRIQVVEAGTPGTVAGVLKKATYVGDHMEYTVETDFGEVFAMSDDVWTHLTIDQSVGVGFLSPGPVLLPESNL